MAFPMFWPDDFVIVLIWLCFQVWIEYVQVTSKASFTSMENHSFWFKLWEMIKDYYNIWNMLDIFRIILMALYVIFTICYLKNKPILDAEDALQPMK
jgi:uncharacterized membrane protein